MINEKKQKRKKEKGKIIQIFVDFFLRFVRFLLRFGSPSLYSRSIPAAEKKKEKKIIEKKNNKKKNIRERKKEKE